MSHPACQTRRVKNELFLERDREEVIALFGQGRLVRVSRLILELRGGSQDDETEATGWVAMFMPDFILAGAGAARSR